MKTFLFILSLVLAMSASAQDQKKEVAGPPVQEEIILPTLPARVNAVQAQAIALSEIRGEVVEVSGYKERDRYYHVVKIRKHDGSVYRVDIFGATGAIVDTRIEQLGPEGKMPRPEFPLPDAKKLAAAHVKSLSSMVQDPVVDSADYKLVDERPVFYIRVKTMTKAYQVIVDARTGKILSARRSD